MLEYYNYGSISVQGDKKTEFMKGVGVQFVIFCHNYASSAIRVCVQSNHKLSTSTTTNLLPRVNSFYYFKVIITFYTIAHISDLNMPVIVSSNLRFILINDISPSEVLRYILTAGTSTEQHSYKDSYCPAVIFWLEKYIIPDSSALQFHLHFINEQYGSP